MRGTHQLAEQCGHCALAAVPVCYIKLVTCTSVYYYSYLLTGNRNNEAAVRLCYVRHPYAVCTAFIDTSNQYRKCQPKITC